MGCEPDGCMQVGINTDGGREAWEGRDKEGGSEEGVTEEGVIEEGVIEEG